MTEVKVPSLAESITEVTLSRWLVKYGDYVELDQPICEFETDKASQELPSPVAGIISLVAKDGDDLKIGAVICKIDETAAKPAAAEKKEEQKDQMSEASVDPEKKKAEGSNFKSGSVRKVGAY